MSCTIKFKTESFLTAQKVIDSENTIIDPGAFRAYNDSLTELANVKYGVGNPDQKLFNVVNDKVVANDRLFNLLEEATFEHEIEQIPTFNNSIKDVIDESKKEILSLKEETNNSELASSNKTYDILFGDKKIATLSAFDVLNNILDNIQSLEGDNNQKLISTVKSLLNKSKAKVKFVEKLKAEDTIMQYNSKTNTIEIDLSILNNATPESVIVSFLHEAVHSISVNLYNEGGGIDAQAFRANLDSLYAMYKRNPIEGMDFDNPLEFLAEVFANPLLKTAINNQQAAGMNIWQQVVAAVRRLLGLSSKFDSKLNEIIENGKTVISTSQNFPELWERKKDAYQEAFVSLKTLEDKFQYALNRLDQSLDQNIRRLHKLAKKAEKKDNEKLKNTTLEKISTLNNIKQEVQESAENNTALGLVSFVNNMTEILNFIEKQIDTIDISNVDGATYILSEYDDYLTTFSVVKDIEDLLVKYKTDPTQTMFTPSELKDLTLVLQKEIGRLSTLNKVVYDFKTKVFKKSWTNIAYFPQILTKYRNKLRKEFNELNLPGDVNVYINENLAENGKEWGNMQADLKDAVLKLLEDPVVDIGWFDRTLSSAVNVSNDLVQLMNKKFMEITNQRMEDERSHDVKLAKAYDALVKEKGTTNVNVLYENITQKTKDGKTYLLGEHKVEFIEEVQLKVKSITAEYKEILDEKFKELKALQESDPNGAEYAKLNKEYNKLKTEKEKKIEAIRLNNLNFDESGKVSPKDKWKNKQIKLSKAEQDILDLFKETIDTGNDVFFNNDSLKKYIYGTIYYELPKVTKSSLERLYSGDVKGSLKEKWDYLAETRADDIEYTNEDIDLGGKKHRQLRAHYRDRGGDFKNESQSIDLASVFRLEFKNMNIYKLRQKKEMELNFLIDIAESKKFNVKKGNKLQRALGNEKLSVTTNTDSNLKKMLNNLMEFQFYDIANSSDQKWGKLDANKAVGYINAMNSFISLSLNFASGTANVLNANAQMFLETFIKGHTFNAKGIAKANKIYAASLKDSLQDNLRGINKSYTNQLSELFNTQGLFNLSDSNFLQTTLLKKGMSLKSLQVFQDSGEHWIQSVLTMAILDNVKVMNANNKFINKDGKIVKKLSEAASLLDMLKLDEKTGLVQLNSKAQYTTHSPNVKWSEGGKEMVDLLIRKKIDDSIGNYTQTQQAEVYRHYGGRLVGLYRKYLIPMGQARFMGMSTAHKDKEVLREDQLNYSHALQEYEEGTYVTLIRYSLTSLKTFKTELLTRSNWKNLSDYEKHNIKRAVTEIVLTGAVLPALIQLASMSAASMDDDEKQKMYFLMYQMRRLITELSSYRSAGEMIKMLKSPIPSVRILESSIDLLEQAFPTNWFEEDAKNNNIFVKKAKVFIPTSKFSKDWEKVFDFQNR